MNKRLHTMVFAGILSAAGTLLSTGVAQAQAPARTYAAAPARSYYYRQTPSGARTYYYAVPTRRAPAYVPTQTARQAARTSWAPYHSSTYYDWSTSREVPMVKPWMRPLR